MAADLSARETPPVFVAPDLSVTWTGFYVGGQVGYGFYAKDDGRIIAPTPMFGGYGRPEGLIGGGHAGYNFALPATTLSTFGFGPSRLIAGLEGDVDGGDVHEPLNPATIGFQTVLRSNLDGSLRLRLGIAVDRVLFYATGGAAFADFDSIYSSRVPAFARTITHSTAGWTVGGGAEYAITPQWSLRAEYRYSDFGSFLDAPIGPLVISKTETQHRVVGGFSYHFLSPAVPVVARY